MNTGGSAPVRHAESRRGRQLLLAVYPPSFRERYGDELAALLDDTGVGPRDVVDLLLGAVRAWLRPSYAGRPAEVRRLRLLSSVSTVWVGFCAVLCGSLGTLRLLMDPAVPGMFGTPRWQQFQILATEALAVAILLVILGGAPVGIRAMRSGAAARRKVVGPVVALVVLALSAGVLVVAESTIPFSSGLGAYPRWYVVLSVATLLASAPVALWWTVAVPSALRASAPTVGWLRVPAVVGMGVVGSLTPPVMLVGAVAFRTVRIWGPSLQSGIVVACVAVVSVTWLVAAVSSLRSLPALWGRDLDGTATPAVASSH